MALGHFDARFRILDSTDRPRLQLVADQRAFFESDINHPERLIHEFEIISQTAQTITIRVERGSSVLAVFIGGGQAQPPRSSWVRSVDYDPKGDYLLMETSIEDSSGRVAEFMESVFPRETLVPAQANTPVSIPLLNDREREPLSSRFRFLDSGPVYIDLPQAGGGTERVQTQVASRFGFDPAQARQKPVAWYVTPNVPDAYLADIKNGVEGWNRYSQAMWKKDIVRFVGKLPVGVKIGDPRYNVISWDSVAEAGAAYESQSADPRTGIQSHSLIYLPFAWINIGKTYWEDGKLSQGTRSEASALAREGRGTDRRKGILGRRLPVNCVRDAASMLSLAARENEEWFARGLLKGTIFHEVGHALGLDHNFKGSLSWDPEDPTTRFSSSIMDYNQYTIERTAFDSLDSSTGPLLEYDRQVLSALYSRGAEIRATDPVLPACDDAEADSFSGGVDPLCIRYDSGSDPTLQASRTIRLVTDASATLEGTSSLPTALSRVIGELGMPADARDLAAIQASALLAMRKVSGLVNFYYVMGSQSIASMARSAVRPLRVLRPGLPDSYDEAAMRQRALETADWVFSQDGFPQATDEALQKVLDDYSVWLLATPVFSGLGDKADPRRQVYDAIVAALVQFKASLSSNGETSTLSYLKGALLGALYRAEGAPFFLSVSDQGVLDVEARVLAWLEKAIVTPAGSGPASFRQRSTALKVLAGFARTESGDAVIQGVRQSLQQELRSAGTAQGREAIRRMLTLIGTRESPSPSDDWEPLVDPARAEVRRSIERGGKRSSKRGG